MPAASNERLATVSTRTRGVCTPRPRVLRAAGVLAACLLVVLAWGCTKRGGPPSPPEGSPPLPEARTTPEARTAPAPTGPTVLLRGARVMTAAGVVYPSGDVLVQGDRIQAVGARLAVPDDATVIDRSGKVITPGLIDTHSHVGVYASPSFGAHADGNEATAPTTPGMRAGDAVWPQDPQLERARAGGVTTLQILPGSANLIGGRSVVMRPYPGLRSLDDALFTAAPAGLKMACGENPKRVYGDKGGPSTRMGNVAGYRKAFQQAVEYRRGWQRYHEEHARWAAKQREKERKLRLGLDDDDEPDDDGKGKGKDDLPPVPPAHDDALQTLVGVLDGEILVHMHCYRADEMTLMMDLARSFGFRVRSFHHAVEAYKIADRLAERDVAVSVWADWWGFKAEAYDGIRENAALVTAAGGRPIIHSDSPFGIQRLNQETAKALFAGRRMGLPLSDDEALRWITANPAWALGIDAEVGTLEEGKRADLVVWSGDPWSVYTRAEQVFIEGRLVYDVAWGEAQPRSDFEVGLRHEDLGRPQAPAVFPPASGEALDQVPGQAKAPATTPATTPVPARPRTAGPGTLPFDRADPSTTFLVGAQVHVGDGTVIEGAVVELRGARIVAVSGPERAASLPAEATIVDLAGKRLTPGLIAAATPLGLVEIDLEGSTVDAERQGADPIRSGYDASVAVHADSSLIPVSVIEGITSAAVTPRGGLLSGQVAWIDLVAGDHRGIVARPRVAAVGQLGSAIAGSRAATFARLREVLDDARLYRDRRAAFDRRQTRDLAAHPLDLEALAPVLDGRVPMVVYADRASDLLALADLAQATGLRVAVVGAAQGWKVADALAEAKIPVVVQPSANLPGSLDQLGARLDNAALLHQAGVRVGIAVLGEAHNVRNVTQEAGIAVAHGLPPEIALSAVSLELARIYGMDAHYGSIAPGKVANLVVWDGDPFELSQWPTAVWVRGQAIPMRSRQTLLRDRYRDLTRFRGDGDDDE